MTITVFATDMDGTFLNSQNDYDRQQFKVLFDQLTKEGKKLLLSVEINIIKSKVFLKTMPTK